VGLVSLLRPNVPKTLTAGERKAIGYSKIERRGKLLIPVNKTIGTRPDRATAARPKGKAAARAAGKRARAARRRNR
jgi:hypothetical protein